MDRATEDSSLVKCGNPYCDKKVETFYREDFCSKECYNYYYDMTAALYEEGQTY